MANASGSTAVSHEAPKRERKPRREHASTVPTVNPASNVAAEHAPPKPGFLRRIARFFTHR